MKNDILQDEKIKKMIFNKPKVQSNSKPTNSNN